MRLIWRRKGSPQHRDWLQSNRNLLSLVRVIAVCIPTTTYFLFTHVSGRLYASSHIHLVHIEMGVLCDLPDELLVNVVRFLSVIRSYETQSTAFKNKKLEKARQCENNIRQQTLHALSLASRRLWRVSLPILYSSSVTCATSKGLRSLQLLHRTLTDSNHVLELSKRKSDHLQYFENRLADYEGNSLQHDEEFQQGPVKTYFRLLADVVMLAPNTEHICVVSLEYDDISFWTHIIDAPQRMPLENPSKLTYLVAQIHAGPTSPDISVSERSIQYLPSYPMLLDFRMSRAVTQRAGSLPLVSVRTLNIQRLELAENSLDVEDVSDLLLACSSLRHFKCGWSFDTAVNVDPSTLHSALLAHADTLETLSLDWREVEFLLSHDANVGLLGSLRSLEVLRMLRISELGFLSTSWSILQSPDMVLNCPLSTLLPESLEYMELLTQTAPHPFPEDGLDKIACLWDLARDCKTSLPYFDAMCINVIGASCLSVLALTDAFEQADVGLHVFMAPEG